MKRILLTIITNLVVFQVMVGQVSMDQLENWDKIIIKDAHSGWVYYSNEFQIKKSTLSLTTVENPDLIIKTIAPELIEELFMSFCMGKGIPKDPLEIFGKDSHWLKANAINLWEEYSKNKKYSKEMDSIAIHAIKDYQNVKEIAWTLQGSHWTDDYPISQISILTAKDTFTAFSTGQYPFMMPWVMHGKYNYDSKIPIIIGQMLPDSIESNKSRLLGTNFTYYLIEKIASNHVDNKVEFVRARNKYPRRFKALSKHFEIVHAEMKMMSSIEWGGFVAANCLEIKLKDSTISNNIQFSTVFGRRIFLHPTRLLIKNKNKILDQLQNNPVFEYCLKNDSVKGGIHFVNRKSLSNKAKNNFLRDVKSLGNNALWYKNKFHNAIFFEFTEYRANQKSFSRWIFLQDGTIILWQLKGGYLMNLPKADTVENGYICKEIKRSEF